MALPMSARWLDARADADAAARVRTDDTLLAQLIEYLHRVVPADQELEIIDLGAGTGANQRWLAPRLPFPQRWIHVDHDPAISRADTAPAGTEVITAGVEVLAKLLERPRAGYRIITCSALLDMLTERQIIELCRLVRAARAPAWFSLNVTGAMSIFPEDDLDDSLLEAHNDHQRLYGRAGPDAVALAAEMLSGPDYQVTPADTPWLLTSDSEVRFVERFLRDRLAASVEEWPEIGELAVGWLVMRRAQLMRGRLTIHVGHRDLLALPVDGAAGR